MFFKDVKNQESDFIIDFHANTKKASHNLYELLYTEDIDWIPKLHEEIFKEIFSYFNKVIQMDLNVKEIIQHHQFFFWY